MLRTTVRALACVAAILAALVAAAPASAGTYTAGWCSQDGASQTVAPPQINSTGGSLYWWYGNSCNSYYYARFENTTVPNGASFDFTYGAPTDTYVSALSWYADAAVRNPGASAGVYAVTGASSTMALSAIAGNGSFSNGGASFSAAQAVKSVRTSIFCANGTGCQFNGSSYGAEIYFGGWRLTLTDPYNPAFTATGGSGWTTTPADSASDSVSYSLSDRGAGVKSVDLYVDGTKKATNNIGCSRSDVPCPLTDSGSFTLDTTQLSEGDHALKMAVTDFSGNATESTQTVTIRRKPAITPDPNPATPGNENGPSVGGITDPFTQGEQATGDKGTWTGSGISYSYQWQRCDANGQGCMDIPGATNLTYTAGASDVGKTLVFCVTGTSTGGTTTQCSAPSPIVQADADGDGVPDALDKCPSTKAATTDGCPAQSTTDVNSVPGPAPTPLSSTTSTTTNQTANPGGRGAANGENATTTARITAVLSNRSHAQKVGYGRRVPITGRLLDPAGHPVAGATLALLVQRSVPGAKFAAAPVKVVTGRDGRFAYTAPAGASRTIRFAYRAFTNDSEFSDTSDVSLLVNGAVTLKAKPARVRNQRAATFRGQLRGKPVPARGVLVDLQVYFHKKWRTFATPRTNGKGAFHYRYRFTQGAAKWTFRARIRKDSLYAYELGYSKKVRVTVTR